MIKITTSYEGEVTWFHAVLPNGGGIMCGGTEKSLEAARAAVIERVQALGYTVEES